MKTIIVVLCVIVCVGCSAPIVKVDIPNINESNSLNVVDLRPEIEKQSEVFGLMVTSSAYGTSRRGDELLNPPAIRILKHRAYEKFSALGEMPEIKVYHFVVYMNYQSELRSVALAAAIGGVIGAGIVTIPNHDTVEGVFSIIDKRDFRIDMDYEYTRALCSEKENPNKASVMVVYIDAEIDGKRTFIKSITPAKLESGMNPHLAAVEAAIQYYLQQY